jgi:NAD(P)-dependent dehydrogenase (short-subunit alcohol dehydrogenase family)
VEASKCSHESAAHPIAVREPRLSGNVAAGPGALESFMEYASSLTPLARPGTDEEVAKIVAFLASDDSSFIAASEIFADGGLAQI